MVEEKKSGSKKKPEAKKPETCPKCGNADVRFSGGSKRCGNDKCRFRWS